MGFEFRSPFLGKRSVPDYFNPPSFVGKRLESDIIPMSDDVVMVPAYRRNRPYMRSRGIVKSARYVSRYPRGSYRSSYRSRSGGWKSNTRIEYKYKDTAVNQAVNTTPAYILLNGTVEGVGPSAHIGRRTTLCSIEMKMKSYCTNTTGVDQNHRIVLVYDRQPNQVAPTMAEVFNAVGENTLRNLDNRSRFTILLDKRIDLNAYGEPGAQQVWNYFKRLRLPTQYDATADDTISSITTGSLYLITYGTEAAGNTAGSLYGNVRVRYSDV